MNRCVIILDDGERVPCDTIEAAAAYLAERFPDAVYSDGHGDVTPILAADCYDPDGRILIWASESDSVNDAGANAIGKIDVDTE